MWNNPSFTFNQTPDEEKLLRYGFLRTERGYEYSAEVLNGEFCLQILLPLEGDVRLFVFERETGEEYLPVYVEDATGAFVGRVRSACEEVLAQVAEACFTRSVFRQAYTKELLSYAKEKYGTEVEYLWEDTPENGILREKKSGKWYAAILSVKRSKLGLEGEGTVEVVNLKDTPERVTALVDGVRYLAGYHMNKKHWYTVRLDGVVPIAEIYERIDASFAIVAKK